MSQEPSQQVQVDVQGGVTTLRLNRPEVMNAFSTSLLGGLRDALAEAKEDASVRCVVVTGSGKAFCAGADLSGAGFEQGVQHMLETYYHPVVEAIVSMPKPVIAAVNGAAAGAGMSLALACDMRLMSSAALLTTGFTGIGLTMDAGGSYFLPRLVGHGRALELGYTARKVAAEEALRLGLVEMLLPAASFEAEVAAFAGTLAQGPTRAYGFLKASVNQSFANTFTEQLALEARLQESAAAGADFREGVRAFTEKRSPVFKGE